MDSLSALNHKIKKYRHKSSVDPGYEDRFLHYIAQNHIVKCGCDDPALEALGQTGGASARKGPEQSATLYKVGTKKTGNDGNKWTIVETANGVKRWKLYKKTKSGSKEKSKTKSKSRSKSKSKSKSGSKTKSSKAEKRRESMKLHSKEKLRAKFNKLGKTTKSFISKTQLSSKDRDYLIHDNGGRPFKVVANSSGIDVYTFKDDPNRDWEEEPDYNVHLLTIKKFIGYWVGFDTSPYTNFHGNSILIQETKHSYVSIGWMIHRFHTVDEILDYVSPVGNSDVPYPVAYGSSNVYFMLDMQYIPKDQLITEATPINAEDMYGEFYGHLHPEHNKNLKKTRMKGVKVLVKRKW